MRILRGTIPAAIWHPGFWALPEDNQGIIGLEVKYEEVLKGINGKILTTTDARGVELNGIGESRVEPVPGYDLYVSMDRNIQQYARGGGAGDGAEGSGRSRC